MPSVPSLCLTAASLTGAERAPAARRAGGDSFARLLASLSEPGGAALAPGAAASAPRISWAELTGVDEPVPVDPGPEPAPAGFAELSAILDGARAALTELLSSQGLDDLMPVIAEIAARTIGDPGSLDPETAVAELPGRLQAAARELEAAAGDGERGEKARSALLSLARAVEDLAGYVAGSGAARLEDLFADGMLRQRIQELVASIVAEVGAPPEDGSSGA